jgi:hypothetical protein
MIRSMRRVLLATLTIVALVAVSFGVGWVTSDSEERAGADRPPAVVVLKPLPVPRVIIQHGPWADPLPKASSESPVRLPRIPLDAARVLAGAYRLLGLDPLDSFHLAGCTACR